MRASPSGRASARLRHSKRQSAFQREGPEEMDELRLRRRQLLRQQRLPIPRQLGEILAYLGGMFAVVAGLLLATEEWPHLGQGGRIALLAGTVALLTAGG